MPKSVRAKKADRYRVVLRVAVVRTLEAYVADLTRAELRQLRRGEIPERVSGTFHDAHLDSPISAATYSRVCRLGWNEYAEDIEVERLPVLLAPRPRKRPPKPKHHVSDADVRRHGQSARRALRLLAGDEA